MGVITCNTMLWKSTIFILATLYLLFCYIDSCVYKFLSAFHPINHPLSLFTSSSCSNKSEPGTVYCGRNFLLADPGAVDYEDMSDPLSRQRSTSFKRAIERGFSGESNLSYETVEPATSPETPDLPPYQCTPGLPTGLPPYIEPPAFRHNTVPDLLHPYCTDDNLATTQANATYMCSTNR